MKTAPASPPGDRAGDDPSVTIRPTDGAGAGIGSAHEHPLVAGVGSTRRSPQGVRSRAWSSHGNRGTRVWRDSYRRKGAVSRPRSCVVRGLENSLQFCLQLATSTFLAPSSDPQMRGVRVGRLAGRTVTPGDLARREYRYRREQHSRFETWSQNARLRFAPRPRAWRHVQTVLLVALQFAWTRCGGERAPGSGCDRRVGRLAPLDPRAVGDPYVRVIEETLEREPRFARPVADRAAGDQCFVLGNACLLEDASQLSPDPPQASRSRKYLA